MSAPVLHYIFDPLCGWCYAAAPLIAATRSIEGLQLELHGGGLMSGSACRKVTPELRSQIMGYDRRIAEVSGQPFGDAYFNGLLLNEDAVLDSTPPIAAILAAEACEISGADMLSALQMAHYIDGLVISDSARLYSLGTALGIAADTFKSQLERQLEGPVGAHINSSVLLMQQVGGRGFPTMVLETEAGFEPLDIGSYFGKPDEWRKMLQSQLHGCALVSDRL
jgi:putative protein-disulfide isomerase